MRLVPLPQHNFLVSFAKVIASLRRPYLRSTGLASLSDPTARLKVLSFTATLRSLPTTPITQERSHLGSAFVELR